MESSEDLIRENNYIFRETKHIGARKIIPEQIQILDNMAYIHEIKDIKNNQNLQQINIVKPNFKINLEIKLEGKTALKENENEDLINNDMNFGNEEVIIESEDNNNLIENIFAKLNNNDDTNDYNNIKQMINSLTEENKKEVIEGIKIKIENEEQENRFNNLLKELSE